MNNFPFFRFSTNPYNNYYNYYNNINTNNLKHSSSPLNSYTQKPYIEDTVRKDLNNQNLDNKKKSSKRDNFSPFYFNIDSLSDSEQPIIEILGIKLYLDDIIILCLLFLLYKEESHDEGLFICLILLLLT